ncbi:unnamed protein product [Pedinophyceae sp. YPF-701]|nr:unnamed protein product [Pedinophyceae sp. YPF-701]
MAGLSLAPCGACRGSATVYRVARAVSSSSSRVPLGPTRVRMLKAAGPRSARLPGVTVRAVAADKAASADSAKTGSAVRVRFAPSPTGNLHVGGARTALFNWLYARNQGGKFIIRVEDTDKARSTRESEEAVLRDLKWMGLDWDEGPDTDGGHGPYRQSERTDIYMKYVNQLVEQGQAYPCFCTDEEIDQMKAEAEEKGIPPVYRGKWKTASKEEVQERLDAGETPVYRFRVPEDQDVTVKDSVRGEVTWNTDTLGDFVIMRSNGLPVYNFCVTVDDALMGVSHVLRAEEHLPNTLRQVLIYRALGFEPPAFGHMSIILAPDRSKLSKRHGATSVGQFADMGYIPEAMINYLALLGWNDGTEQEIYEIEELTSKFTLDRITKSAGVFDVEKLRWMNGQILRALPDEDATARVGAFLAKKGVLAADKEKSPWVARLVAATKKSLDLLADAEKEIADVVSYPLEETVASDACQSVIEDDFGQLCQAVLAAWDSGELAKVAAEEGGLETWFKAVGKEQGRKGKRLFLPMRVALTGKLSGADIGDQLLLLSTEDGELVDRDAIVSLEQRMERLRAYTASL